MQFAFNQHTQHGAAVPARDFTGQQLGKQRAEHLRVFTRNAQEILCPASVLKRRLKRGVFHSVVDLQAAINRFAAEHNEKPKPFTWTADPNKIIAAVKRGHQVLDSIH